MIATLLIKIIFYIFWIQIIVFIFSSLGKIIKSQLRRSMRMANKRTPTEQKPSLLKLLSRGVRFEMKGDKRPLGKKLPIQRTLLYWIIFGTGLLLTVVSSLVDSMAMLYIVALFLSLLSQVYAYLVSKGLLNDQEKIKQRLYDSKKDVMGLVSNAREGVNYDAEFKILEWDKDNLKFNKVLMYIPTSFDQLNTGAVIDKMNQNFGGGTAWVADVESDTKGWDFVRGMVTLKRTAELPHMAPWDEHYILNDDIAWSFFPLGLGVEHGVELMNPETGKTENVLGFDLQGLEQKLGKKKGFYVGPEIIAAPMVLVSGGTGGGKSLSNNTVIPTVNKD